MDDIEVQVKIRDVNPHIVCSLCAGYFVEATTVTECLHTFCKSCIVKYLQSSKCCPTCNLQIHETQPLLNLQLDRTMQDVVHKVVPGIEEDEERRKREFYDLRGLPVERPAMLIHALEQDHGEKPQHIKRDFSEHKNSYRDDELVSLCIERYGSDEDEENSDHDNSMEGDSKNHPVCKSSIVHLLAFRLDHFVFLQASQSCPLYKSTQGLKDSFQEVFKVFRAHAHSEPSEISQHQTQTPCHSEGGSLVQQSRYFAMPDHEVCMDHGVDRQGSPHGTAIPYNRVQLILTRS
ncbi:polycomb group RING finger protein 1 isoform X1 [Nematostella vectensis]|uniref:polycomb group RING finger protein 1 isoform X1 n=1 Tax=Nematostella vectensis TaxID=45351 RepID=UPI00207709C1|nr:polycomb group RING finger protein 1 isoform X1 [Nematostella vectensis]